LARSNSLPNFGIPTETLLAWVSNAGGISKYLVLASITAGPLRVVNSIRRWSMGYSTYASSVSRYKQTPPRHASVNLVYEDQLASTSTPETTEQNLIVRINKSEDEVTNNKRLRSRHCTLEANCREAGTKHRAAFLRQQSFLF